MSVTTTPQGTIIIHALSLGQSLAQIAVQIPFAPKRLKSLADQFDAALGEAKLAVAEMEAKIPPPPPPAPATATVVMPAGVTEVAVANPASALLQPGDVMVVGNDGRLWRGSFEDPRRLGVLIDKYDGEERLFFDPVRARLAAKRSSLEGL